MTEGFFGGQEGARAPGGAKNPRGRGFFDAVGVFLEFKPFRGLNTSSMHYGVGIPAQEPLGVMGGWYGVGAGWGGGGWGGFGAPQGPKSPKR